MILIRHKLNCMQLLLIQWPYKLLQKLDNLLLDKHPSFGSPNAEHPYQVPLLLDSLCWPCLGSRRVSSWRCSRVWSWSWSAWAGGLGAGGPEAQGQGAGDPKVLELEVQKLKHKWVFLSKTNYITLYLCKMIPFCVVYIIIIYHIFVFLVFNIFVISQ